jgi:hypothetical protein
MTLGGIAFFPSLFGDVGISIAFLRFRSGAMGMLRIDKNAKKLVRLTKSALADADHWERQLQAMICAEPDAFCDEIGERLWVVGQEIRPSDAIPDRIDILAIDEQGGAVVIELKRGSHKLQLLQAVSYAGMISRWPSDRFVENLATNYSQSLDEARSAIEDHIGSEISSINHAQRILLIAEDFDPALLIAAEWLHESFNVDIRCYRLQLSQESGNDYLTCTCVYPPIEIATLKRGAENKSGQAQSPWPDWNTALSGMENSELRKYFAAELAKHQENRLSTGEIIYRLQGKRRFWLRCTTKYGYVYQWPRFEDDIEYWRKKLSEPNHIRATRKGQALRFHLVTAADFAAFANAMTKDLLKTEFSEGADFNPPEDGD